MTIFFRAPLLFNLDLDPACSLDPWLVSEPESSSARRARGAKALTARHRTRRPVPNALDLFKKLGHEQNGESVTKN